MTPFEAQAKALATNILNLITVHPRGHYERDETDWEVHALETTDFIVAMVPLLTTALREAARQGVEEFTTGKRSRESVVDAMPVVALVAWLIERKRPEFPSAEWLMNHNEWTTDAHLAVWFVRKQDAERVRYSVLTSEPRAYVCDHQFIGSVLQTSTIALLQAKREGLEQGITDYRYRIARKLQLDHTAKQSYSKTDIIIALDQVDFEKC